MSSSSLSICCQVFFSILLNKWGEEVHENFISCFMRKNLISGNLIFTDPYLMLDWILPKVSQATVTNGSSKIQDMIKILKQSGENFSGKCLCGGYCS